MNFPIYDDNSKWFGPFCFEDNSKNVELFFSENEIIENFFLIIDSKKHRILKLKKIWGYYSQIFNEKLMNNFICIDKECINNEYFHFHHKKKKIDILHKSAKSLPTSIFEKYKTLKRKVSWIETRLQDLEEKFEKVDDTVDDVNCWKEDNYDIYDIKKRMEEYDGKIDEHIEKTSQIESEFKSLKQDLRNIGTC